MIIQRKLFVCIFLTIILAVPAYSTAFYRQLTGITILLDPGHGGSDPGAVGTSKLKESETNLRVARYLKYLLEADGATVIMTRNSDKALSLGERVNEAVLHRPDLFLSIHHNSSLTPVAENRAEFYYAAQDYGLSKRLAESMAEEFKKAGFGNASTHIPGGFYLLRNSPVPAIITEGAYISLKETEKALMTGRFLTNQAQAMRTAIKKILPEQMIRVNLYADSEIKLDSPYFNLLLASDKPLEKVNARLSPKIGNFNLGFEPVLKWCNSHKIYNKAPLHSGKFDLSLLFFGKTGEVSGRHNLSIEVNLPTKDVIVSPVAPYIPKGFKGRFPVLVTLVDCMNRPNTKAAELFMYSKKPYISDTNQIVSFLSELTSLNLSAMLFNIQRIEGSTDNRGIGLMYLDLNGTERDYIMIQAESESALSKPLLIPILEPSKTFILGKVLSEKRCIENELVCYDNDKTTLSLPFGYFFFESDTKDLKIEVKSKHGYYSASYSVEGIKEPVHLPVVELIPIAEHLLGTEIGFYFEPELCKQEIIRMFVQSLEQAGARITNLKPQKIRTEALYQAVLNANLRKDLSSVMFVKKGQVKYPELRHYHREGAGSKLATRLSKKLKEQGIMATATAGGDYEINNTQATALAVVLPQSFTDHSTESFLKGLCDAIKAE